MQFRILPVRFITIVVFTFLVKTFMAQMSGVYNVPGNFSSLAAAVASLNAVGVNGPVTINISAGYTETVAVKGLSLTATGTSVNPITFMKNGTGANPILYAFAGGNATPSSNFQDGIFRLIGSDYITIDGIDFVDPYTSGNAMMEYGIGFFRVNSTNGCQYNTIKNCNISLSRNNNAYVSTFNLSGSKGIEVICSTYNSHLGWISPTAFSGTHSYNKFYSNTISNCNTCIALIALSTNSQTIGADIGNDIGGNSVSTGNTFVNFGGATSATEPAYGIYCVNNYSLNVSNNTINNNTGIGVNHIMQLNGIMVYSPNDTYTKIMSNTVTVNGGGTYSELSAIHVEDFTVSGVGTHSVLVKNNLITNCTYTSSIGGDFLGIYIRLSNGKKAKAIENVFLNNTSAIKNGRYYSIFCSELYNDSLIVSNNLFDGVVLTSSLTSASLKMIATAASVNSPGILSVNSNSVQNISFPATSNGNFSMVYIPNSYNKIILDNNKAINLSFYYHGTVTLFESANGTNDLTISNNSIIGGFTDTSPFGDFHGIKLQSFAGSGTATIINNDISNVTVAGGLVYGLNVLGGASQIQNVLNNRIANYTGGSLFTGIALQAGGIGSQIKNNLVSNINNTGFGIDVMNGNSLSILSNTICSIVSNTLSVVGLKSFSGSNITISKNKLYDLQANGNSTVLGITLQSCSGNNFVTNNLIGDLKAPSSGSGMSSVIGLQVDVQTANSKVNVYHNSVYLSGTSSSINFGSIGFYHAHYPTYTDGLLDFRNNLIVNNCTPTTNGRCVAFYHSGLTFENYSNTSNNNILYAGIPGNSNLIGHCSIVYPTLSSFQTAVSPRESNSATENTPFVSTLGSNNNFLNISTTIPTKVENGGFPLSLVTDDYAGNPRNPTNPDIGAWEGNYLIADSVYPVINGVSNVSGNCNLSAVTLTANLIDAIGVASGSLSPRCYYKVNSGPYSSAQGTLTAGTFNNGTWAFNLNYSAVPSNTISYFFVAQDINGSPNIGSLPQPGMVATDVNNVTTPPGTVFTYTVKGVLNGTYTVGTSGNFTTLTAAANAYNNWCITGPVTFLLSNPNYDIGETFPIVFQKNPDASNTNSLLIRPSPGVNSTITSTATVGAVLKFLDAKYITVDGIKSAGSSLKIHKNTSGAVVWIACSTEGNKRVKILNCDIRGGGNNTAGFWGILAGINNSWPYSLTGGNDNDSLVIQGNSIERVFDAIFAGGGGTVSVGGLDGLTIKDNIIGPAISGTNNIGGIGINIHNALNYAVQNNLIQNISAQTTGISGILLNQLNTGSVSQNTINGVSCSVATYSTNSICGLYIGNNLVNTNIEKNTICNILNNGPGYYGARGITIRTTSNSSINLRNNFVANIRSGGDQPVALWPIGISIESISGGLNIYNNSISLAGAHNGYVGMSRSAAIYMEATGGNINLINNIISNTYDNTNSSTDVVFGIYSIAPPSAFTTINYNDYYVGGGANTKVLGFISGSAQNNLAAIQSSFGGNLNSQNIAPVFSGLNDLHLPPINNIGFNDLGTPIPSVTDDIDNQVRNATNPDIGADEYSTVPCNTVSAGIQGISSTTVCSGQNITLTANGATSDVGMLYQWQVSTTSGGPYSSVTTGTGSATTGYSFTISTPGVYYYTMSATCASSSLTSVTNESTVTVLPNPTATITANTPLCNGQTLNLNGNTTIGNTFSWLGPNSFTSNLQNPSISNISLSGNGTYTFITSASGCSVATTYSVIVNLTPTVVIVPSNTIICAGNSVTLTANGASTYTWNTGSNNTTITDAPVTNTVYTLSGQTPGGCLGSHTLAIVVTPCTNVTETLNTVGVNLFPNPNQGKVTLQLHEEGLFIRYEIYNTLGQIIQCNRISESVIQIDLSKVSAGLYHVKLLKNDGVSSVYKIIRE